MTLYPRTAFVRSAIVVGLVIGISQALTLWFFARNAYLPGIREYARLTVLQAELAFDDSRAAADADLADRLVADSVLIEPGAVFFGDFLDNFAMPFLKRTIEPFGLPDYGV